MTLFLSLSLSHIKYRILSLSLSFRLRRRQFKCQTPKKPLFRGVNRPLGKSSLALSFSHTNTLLRIKPHSRTKLTLYFSLSSISLPHSIFKTYLHLSFSHSLSLFLFQAATNHSISLSHLYGTTVSILRKLFFFWLSKHKPKPRPQLSLSGSLWCFCFCNSFWKNN